MAVEALPLHLEPHPDISQDGVFTFLTNLNSFSYVERKNPLAVVRAFKAAFDKGKQRGSPHYQDLEQEPSVECFSGRRLARYR